MHDVVIKNLSKTKHVIVFKHQEYCVKIGRCSCGRNGVPKSVTILPGQSVTLEGHVLSIPSVIEAKKRNQIATDKVKKKVAGSAVQEVDANTDDRKTSVPLEAKAAARKKTNGKGMSKSRRKRGSQG